MELLFQHLLEIMKLLGLNSSFGSDVLVALIFCWSLCAAPTEEVKRAVLGWVAGITGKKVPISDEVHNLVKAMKSCFAESRFYHTIVFFFPFTKLENKTIKVVQLIALYYMKRYGLKWNQLPQNVQNLLNGFSVTEKGYEQWAKTMGGIELQTVFPPKRINGKLEACEQVVKDDRGGYSVLFENIAAVKTNKPGKVKQPLNPYATSKRKQGYDHIERGLNINEEIYNTVYDNLKDVPSSEIINQLKYYDKQYDTSYETIFLLSELNRCAKEGDSLVVNATPETIKYIAEHEIRITIAVPDDAIKDMYISQFNNMDFVTFDQLLNSDRRYMNVLLIIRKSIFAEEVNILNAFSCSAPGAFVLLSVSESILRKKFYERKDKQGAIGSAFDIMLEKNIYPYRILHVPDEVTQSKPKTKYLMYCQHVEKPYGFIQLFDSRYDKDEAQIRISDESAYVTPAELELKLQEKCTKVHKAAIRKLIEENVAKHSVPIEKKKHEATVKYNISREIVIQYNADAQETRNIRYYYKPIKLEIRNPSKDKNTSRDKVIDAEVEINDYLETVAVDELIEIIENDLKAISTEELATFTLKSLWLCYRSEIQKKPGYDEKICQTRVFCKNSEISDLILLNTEEERLKEINLGYEKEAAKHIWKQVKIIADVLVGHKIIKDSALIDTVIGKLQKPGERSGEQEVQDALDCPGFTLDQQRYIWKQINEKCDPKQYKGAQYFYEVDSKRLFLAAKFLNGSILGELLAATWGDIENVLNDECCSLSITQRMTANESIVNYAIKSPELKTRKISLNPVFSKMLSERKAYLERNCPVAMADSAPLFLEIEPTRKNPGKLITMKWETASKIIKDIKNKVNEAFPMRKRKLPDDDNPDIYEIVRPYRGDILKRNFEYSCVDYTRMKGGLLDYLFGRQPDLTHDLFYVDYGCDEKIVQTAKGFYRWTTRLTPETIEPTNRIYKVDKSQNDKTIFDFRDYMRLQLGVKVQSKETKQSTIRIRVKSKHAIDVSVAILKKEEKADE